MKETGTPREASENVRSLGNFTSREAMVDHKLACLADFNERRRESIREAFGAIGRNRGEVDIHLDRLNTRIDTLRSTIAWLWLCVVMLALGLAVALVVVIVR